MYLVLAGYIVHRVGHLTFGIWIGYKKKLVDIFSKVAFVYCLNLPTFSRNLAQYQPYTKPLVTFTMASSSQSRRARVRPMNGTLLGHVSLLPRQSILAVRKSEFGTHHPVTVPKTSVRGQNWLPSTYRSYHSSNGTILATDLRQHFCRCWASVGPYLTSHLGRFNLSHKTILLKKYP